MDIVEFYQSHEVDEDFDEVYYEEQCPNVISFYEPSASSIGITKRDKYFYHYCLHGKELGLLKKNEPIKHSISVLIACKNRDKNLAQVVGSWHDIDYVKEIVLVDYCSDEKIKIEGFDKLKTIRVEAEEFFNLGKAYNLAFDFCTGDFILKVDSDYLCIDPLWIDSFFKNVKSQNYYIRGDYGFSRYTSGFFLIHRKYFEYFREDLNGYGYDEIDLYNRIRDIHGSLKEIIFFDIDKYIYHIPHEHEQRSSSYANKDVADSEEKNRFMCELHSPHRVSRLSYFSTNDSIRYQHKNIDKFFCINLDERTDRWESLKNNNLAERISAVDSRINRKIHEEYGLGLHPCNLSAQAYFNCSHGAIGAYLSHYSIWKKIVNDNIPHALIIEDDVEEDAIEKILHSNIIFDDYDIINLSKRISWDKSSETMFFDGAESYILSNSGAKKLINATRFPILLDKVNAQVYDSLKDLEYLNWNHTNSIVAPVDKFIGYCCDNRADERIRLKKYLYPIIDLGEKSFMSDINPNHKCVWEMNTNEIMRIINAKT